jgi:hypothetical protein
MQGLHSILWTLGAFILVVNAMPIRLDQLRIREVTSSTIYGNHRTPVGFWTLKVEEVITLEDMKSTKAVQKPDAAMFPHNLGHDRRISGTGPHISEHFHTPPEKEHQAKAPKAIPSSPSGGHRRRPWPTKVAWNRVREYVLLGSSC